MKRNDEEFCRSEFEKFLSKEFDQIQWEEVDQSQEPPDYYLQLGNLRFAVEVTGLQEMIQISPRLLTSAGMSAASKNFMETVERTARNQGILAGAYVVTLKPLDNFAEVKELITERIFDYLRATKLLANAPEEILFEQGHHALRIQKVHAEEDYLTYGISLDAKWEVESKDEVRQSLTNILVKKKQKLRKVNYPKILLVLDSYHYLPSSKWKECLSDPSLLSGFHTLFLVSTEGSNILYSEDNNWMV